MNNEAEAWAEREMRRMKIENENVPDYSNQGPYGGDVIDESDILIIEMPLEGFSDESIACLMKLIARKANLIKKAIGADALPVERTETTLRFPWFSFSSSVDEISAYTRFISALCASARSRKRVPYRRKPIKNEKVVFRTFLIQLGFVGDDYYTARKILLRNLSGKTAFANIQPEVPHE